MHLKPGQDFFPNSEDTLLRESKCAKDTIWRLRKAEAKYFIICKDNGVQNFLLKFSQFGIKCSTERKRTNLYSINGCV